MGRIGAKSSGTRGAGPPSCYRPATQRQPGDSGPSARPWRPDDRERASTESPARPRTSESSEGSTVERVTGVNYTIKSAPHPGSQPTATSQKARAGAAAAPAPAPPAARGRRPSRRPLPLCPPRRLPRACFCHKAAARLRMLRQTVALLPNIRATRNLQSWAGDARAGRKPRRSRVPRPRCSGRADVVRSSAVAYSAL